MRTPICHASPLLGRSLLARASRVSSSFLTHCLPSLLPVGHNSGCEQGPIERQAFVVNRWCCPRRPGLRRFNDPVAVAETHRNAGHGEHPCRNDDVRIRCDHPRNHRRHSTISKGGRWRTQRATHASALDSHRDHPGRRRRIHSPVRVVAVRTIREDRSPGRPAESLPGDHRDAGRLSGTAVPGARASRNWRPTTATTMAW